MLGCLLFKKLMKTIDELRNAKNKKRKTKAERKKGNRSYSKRMRAK